MALIAASARDVFAKVDWTAFMAVLRKSERVPVDVS